MVKRGRLEITKDILLIIQQNSEGILYTHLLRKANLSSKLFIGYYNFLINKEFIRESNKEGKKLIILTDKGCLFLEKYKTILNFIEEFEL